MCLSIFACACMSMLFPYCYSLPDYHIHIHVYILYYMYMYCLILGLLHHSEPFFMVLWYRTLVHVEMLIWAVHLLWKKLTVFSLKKGNLYINLKISLNSLKIMNSYPKNLKKYCHVLYFSSDSDFHFLLLCRTWNTAPWRSCPSVWRTWGSV